MSIYTASLSAALTGTAIAANRGATIPDGLCEADQLIAELQRLAMPQPPEPLPNMIGLSAAELRVTLAEASLKRVEAGGVRELAEQCVAGAVADYLAAYRHAWPEFLPQLADDFDQAAAEFLEAVRTAPAAITASTTDDQVDAHRRLLRSVSALDTALRDRVVLGESIAEQGAGYNTLLLVAELPAPPHEPNAFNAAWVELSDFVHRYPTIPAGIERWRAIADSECVPRLALAGELQTRKAELGRWQSLSMTLNTTYGGSSKFAELVAAG